MSRVGSTSRRQFVVLVMVLALMAAYAVRLVYVQVVAGPGLAAQARELRTDTLTLHAQRGAIVDADGNVLATSQMRYDIWVDQRQIPAFKVRDADGEVTAQGALAAAELLAPILDLDAHELGAQLTGDAGVRIARDVTPEVRAAVVELGIGGAVWDELTTVRDYPATTTGGNLVGWVNEEGAGASGLEYALEAELSGANGETVFERGLTGQVIPGAPQHTTPAQDGRTVNTTLEQDLEFRAEEVIDGAVEQYGADWGAVVVIEVGTGRILALAESGAIDPNDPSGFGGSRAIQDPYEPGSTGKILTVAAAIEEGVVEPDTVFQVPYRYTTSNGQTFKDHTEHPDEQLTTAGILADSSNTGTIQIGERMSDDVRARYMQDFGWGAPSGIELTGESTGSNLDPTGWDGRTRYATMFGQGLSVNLLQNTNVIATLANDGVHVQPHLVDGYTDTAGTFTPAELEEPRQVVSPETSEQVIRMLEGVTAAEGATGTRAAIDGYRVAGKTGTAEIMGPGGELSDTVASFVGVAPAEDPQIAVGVVVYRPDTGFYGGTIAAPVFRDVASFALTSLGVPPSAEPADLYPLTPAG
ncbi:Peptidoglycan glycosyltransferase [Beutenbergia cavernae DSM 12333]|uniref:Peptidoglycan glycosyltransferase n=1 Tax=Beutenbergia cavernae (strain ATCC BAA-8 / DSM 12333 / CCUG 43141 / JCM 11478 / NBRC 16432 / NCIMB 13614 / HKI 0122) TaxID=471853 RepID=C5BW65_BEUC1|nr:penicillin-binding protein 2 [Beutenbergia cavernae]ACQ80666.1 Peptidoglycan glycosyltransferase [Beutenbergia cavernae DSM 12333]